MATGGKKQKKAIALTPEQTARSNKLGVGIYGVSLLGWVMIMLITHSVTIVGLAVMAVCYAMAVFWGLTQGKRENTHIKMSFTYLIPFIVVSLTSSVKIYPVVFITVYALIVYQNVRLVAYGTGATVIVNIIDIGMSMMRGQMAPDDAASELISTILFGLFSMYTALRIYYATKENMDQIQKQTNEAIQVANHVGAISQDILDNFHIITDGMHNITEQANENKGALSDISSASSVNSEEMNHQSELTQNIYGIVQETQASAERVQQNAQDVYEKVSEGVVLSEDMRTQAQEVSADIKATNQIVTDLVGQIQGVSSITDAILSISSQTNLLALNASIEAARAGEAGKGFAVVADEIRTLAEQTKHSTEEITQIMNQLILVANQSVEKMNRCVEGIQLQNTKIDDVNGSFEQTKKNVGALKTMVDGIIDGVNEVSNNTAQIVNSVVSVSENTNRVFELSGNGVDGAEMIYATIQEFSDTIGRLHAKVEQLKNTIAED
ncbi:MAG: methyl-accepting chemotaxis protein [Lachnospiraceae bacterium]|nr:methyl-accepting chemotaxis protein [Lachnospiraceae bacterium]